MAQRGEVGQVPGWHRAQMVQSAKPRLTEMVQKGAIGRPERGRLMPKGLIRSDPKRGSLRHPGRWLSWPQPNEPFATLPPTTSLRLTEVWSGCRDDGAGNNVVKFHDICAHFKWGDPLKLCGPYICSMDPKRAFGLCCYGHDANAPEHQMPKVNSKAFVYRDYLAQLRKLKLVGVATEVLGDRKAGALPPGQPSQTATGTLIYPTRKWHFA